MNRSSNGQISFNTRGFSLYHQTIMSPTNGLFRVYPSILQVSFTNFICSLSIKPYGCSSVRPVFPAAIRLVDGPELTHFAA